MFNIKTLLSAFKPTVSFTHKKQLSTNSDIAKGVVTRLAKGSHSLQNGHFLTKKDINKRVESVLNYNFSK